MPQALHQYDCQRANKSTFAWGLEARVPFLDKEFINVAMNINPENKMIKKDEGRIEKYILRKAFDDEENPYLPKHILYRQKEQFSDGVGYSWIDGLKAHAAKHRWNLRASTHEGEALALLNSMEWVQYMGLHSIIFASDSTLLVDAIKLKNNSARLTVLGGPTVACSTTKAVEWDASWSKNFDPSGRAALGVHDLAYENQNNIVNKPVEFEKIIPLEAASVEVSIQG
ncbi:hypothetical protein TSUD_373550 [Trifolium subterraneum]|uniref:Asparagine synthetase domain-containing protein n=1 Tax=Trifolium subterraneum TaxID=3900 RepID=A0A2Z6M0K2_TRISU|nr:hypothetical protein TSUD_373550 [Trifolium subterraneum]